MTILLLFFKLLIAHAVADFVLQPGPMSAGKDRRNELHLQYGDNFPPWYYWLISHAMAHAAFVWLITDSVVCALLEIITHALIDYGKCERWLSFHQDQLLHMLVKVLYCVLIAYNLV